MIDIDVQMLKNEITLLKAQRDWEAQTRLAINGDLGSMINDLYPDTSAAWRSRNSHVPNELGVAVDRIRDAIKTADVSWEYGATSDSTDEEISRFLRNLTDLVGDMATEILVGGRFALYPYLSARTRQLELSVLSGYTLFVLDAGNSSIITAVAQVIPNRGGAQLKYDVTVYGYQEIAIWKSLTDWVDFLRLPPQETYKVPYVPDLPVIPGIVRRGADRYPAGLAGDAMPAFKRFVRDAINYNASSEMYGRPETVVKSDHYLRELSDQRDSPLIQSLREKGPAALKIVGSDEDYVALPPVDLSPLQSKEDRSKQDINTALKAPTIGAADLSGEALQELRNHFTQTVTSYSKAIAEGLTQAARLAAGIPGSKLPADIEITLKPKFVQDVNAERATISKMFESGMIPDWVALTAMQQLGVDAITDELINTLKDKWEADLKQAEQMPQQAPTPQDTQMAQDTQLTQDAQGGLNG